MKYVIVDKKTGVFYSDGLGANTGVKFTGWKDHAAFFTNAKHAGEISRLLKKEGHNTKVLYANNCVSIEPLSKYITGV